MKGRRDGCLRGRERGRWRKECSRYFGTVRVSATGRARR